MLEKAHDGRMIDATGMDDEMRMEYGLRPRVEPIEWMNDDERVTWLSAFGAAIGARGFTGSIDCANRAVTYLRALEPECAVIEVDSEWYRDMLKKSYEKRGAGDEFRAATHKGRRGHETRAMQADGTIERTFYCVKREPSP